MCRDFNNKKVFTVIHMADGFWHVKLSEKASYLCTFKTPWGQMRFKRMPFGIASASEMMQKNTQETFGDIPGVNIIADDLIIAAEMVEELDQILQQVMQRAREERKVQFRVPQVLYMGNVVTADGLRPDKAKIQAIANMPTPEDKPALLRLLGMVKYLSQYVPNESEVTAPLRALLKNDAAWCWEAEHDRSLDRMTLASEPVQRYYDVTIEADASQARQGWSGVGGVYSRKEGQSTTPR